MYTAGGAGNIEPGIADIDRLAEVNRNIGVDGHIRVRTRRRAAGDCGRRVGSRATISRVRAQPAERIGRETGPFDGWIKGIAAIRVTRTNVGIAGQGIVGRAGQTAAPLAAGVEPDLSDHIQDGCAFAQHNRIVAVVPAGGAGLIGLGQDHRVGRGRRNHVNIAIGHRTGQVNGQASSGSAIEIHLDVITTGSQVNGSAGAIIDFEGFVVAGTFNIF